MMQSVTYLAGVDKVKLKIDERVRRCLVGGGQLVGDQRLHLLRRDHDASFQGRFVVQEHDVDLLFVVQRHSGFVVHDVRRVSMSGGNDKCDERGVGGSHTRCYLSWGEEGVKWHFGGGVPSRGRSTLFCAHTVPFTNNCHVSLHDGVRSIREGGKSPTFGQVKNTVLPKLSHVLPGRWTASFGSTKLPTP